MQQAYHSDPMPRALRAVVLLVHYQDVQLVLCDAVPQAWPR